MARTYRHHQFSLGYKISPEMQEKFYFDDTCSRVRHFLARLGWCRHRGKWLSMKEYFEKAYRDLPERYPSVFDLD